MPLLADADFAVAKSYDAYSGLAKAAKRARSSSTSREGGPPPRPRARSGLPDGGGSEEDARRAARGLCRGSAAHPSPVQRPPGLRATAATPAGWWPAELGGAGAEVTCARRRPWSRADGGAPRRRGRDRARRGHAVAEGRAAEPTRATATDAGESAEAAERVAAGLARWTAAHPFPPASYAVPTTGRRRPRSVSRRARRTADTRPLDLDAAGDTARPARVRLGRARLPHLRPVANLGAGPADRAGPAGGGDRPEPALGEPYVIVSWELGREGRKREAAAACSTPGARAARSRALWIELREE